MAIFLQRDNNQPQRGLYCGFLQVQALTNPMTVPTKPMRAVTRATGVNLAHMGLVGTFATIAEAVNLPLTMIKRLMNHVTTNDVTGGYIFTEEETLREAISNVADYIQARVTQKNNVIQIRTNK